MFQLTGVGGNLRHRLGQVTDDLHRADMRLPGHQRHDPAMPMPVVALLPAPHLEPMPAMQLNAQARLFP